MCVSASIYADWRTAAAAAAALAIGLKTRDPAHRSTEQQLPKPNETICRRALPDQYSHCVQFASAANMQQHAMEYGIDIFSGGVLDKDFFVGSIFASRNGMHSN